METNRMTLEMLIQQRAEGTQSIDQATTAMKKNKTVLDQVSKSEKEAGRQAYRLKMEFLGVMFFGMLLQQTFTGLLNPVFETYGVFQIFSDMLTVLFIPIMETLFPILLGIAELFMSLPEPIQFLIGAFVVLAAAFGIVLFWVGALTIGLDALGMSLGSLGTMFKAFLPYLVPLAIFFLGLRDIITGWGNDTKKVVRGVLLVLTGLAAAVAIFLGAPALAVAAIATAVAAAIYLIVKHWEDIKAFFTTLITWFGDWAKKVASKIADMIPDWIKDLIKKGVDVVSNVTSKVKSFFGGGSPEKFNDMIWRPGSDPIAISPQDTLVATKNGMPGGNNVSVSNTYNINGGNSSEIKRVLDQRDSELLAKIRRQTG